MKIMSFCVALPLAALASGCATLTQGTTQTVVVTTDPAGARCAFTRDSKQFAVIDPTPGSVPVDKARATIAIACRKEGFLEASGQLASEFQAMTFGNILFGGIIGIAVDAASGAMNKYPEAVTITLVPAEFSTVELRDEFFDRMRDTLRREAAEVKERIAKVCRRGNCNKDLADADAATNDKLADIEQQRARAIVATR